MAGGSGESPPAAGPAAVQTVMTGTLTELMTEWSGNRFPRRAWSGDGRVGIAAPPYAGSLVVSGPLHLVLPLTTSELEAFPVSRHRPLPTMTS